MSELETKILEKYFKNLELVKAEHGWATSEVPNDIEETAMFWTLEDSMKIVKEFINKSLRETKNI